MPRFAHLVFDLDGTLLDTRRDLALTTNYVLRRLHRPPLPLEEIGGFIGLGARTLIERALGATANIDLQGAYDLFLTYYRAHLLDHTQPYAGLERVLTAAHSRGATLSVLTNKPEALARALLEGVQLSHLIRQVVGGDSVATKKPDPLGLHELQARSGVAAERTLLIGDSWIDMETGKAAGVATCGVLWGYGHLDLASTDATYLVASPSELGSLLAD